MKPEDLTSPPFAVDPVDEAVSFRQWLIDNGLTCRITEFRVGLYRVAIDHAEFKLNVRDRILRSVYETNDNPVIAIRKYSTDIAGMLLVLNAGTPAHRREIRVPQRFRD